MAGIHPQAMTGPEAARCTCAGCPPDERYRLLLHWFQLEAWEREKRYEPCRQEGCCGCTRPVTQEDLLCDECRERGGISKLQPGRVAELLAEPAGRQQEILMDALKKMSSE